MAFFYLLIFITSNVSEYNVHYYYRKKKKTINVLYCISKTSFMSQLRSRFFGIWLDINIFVDLIHSYGCVWACLGMP